MGILDFLTNPAKKAGQDTFKNIIGNRSSGQTGGGSGSRTSSLAPVQIANRQQPPSAVGGRSGLPGGQQSTQARAPAPSAVGGRGGAAPTAHNPTEQMMFYPVYPAMHGASTWYAQNVEGPFSAWINRSLSLQNIERTTGLTQSPGNLVDIIHRTGQSATGLVAAPGLVAEFIGMVPAGAERLVKEGVRDASTLPYHATAGLVMQGEGIAKGIKENPGRTAGELVGMGLVTHGAARAGAASPVKFALGRANFPAESFTSLGIEVSRGNVVGFRPLVGLSKTAGGTRPTLGTPSIRIEAALGGERFTPATPLETRIVQGALGGQEAARIGYARNVRTVTQSSGLALKQVTPVVKEVLQQHNIPNTAAVSQVIVKALKADNAQLYGSVIQRGIGQEVGGVGLSRVPRDFDVQVSSTPAFQKRIVADINRAAGREVVIPEGKAGVLVKQTGEKLFDLHDMETALAERQFTPKAPSEYIAFGIKGEKLIKTKEGVNSITLSEQATRKLEGSMQLRPQAEVTHVDGSSLMLRGQLLPKKPGRIKDIGDYYFAEKLSIDVMRGSKNPVKIARAISAEKNLDKFLGTWGGDIAASVRAQYIRELAGGNLSVKLADFSTPAAKTPTSSGFKPVTLQGSGLGASPSAYISPSLPRSQNISSMSPSMYAASEFTRGGSPSAFTSPSLPRSPNAMISPPYSPFGSSPGRSSLPSPPAYNPPTYSPPPSPPPSPPSYSPPTSPPTSPPAYSPPHSPPYRMPPISLPATPPITTLRPPQSRLKLDDDRKIRAIRPDLSLKGFDWTVKNPVPTFASVFGTGGKTPNLKIKLPEFKI